MEAIFPLILIVDDDPIIRRILSDNLELDGYDVVTAADGREALIKARRRIPELAVIDLLLPDIHGFELARKLKSFVDLPIIFLTAVGSEETEVEGISRYAEDYVVKPFSYPRFIARLHRVLKRTRHLVPRESQIRLSADVLVDLPNRMAFRSGQGFPLTPIECRLLSCFARRSNRVLSTEELVDAVWGDREGDRDRLYVHIRNLRRKLESDPDHPEYLLSYPGKGYSLVLGGTEAAPAGNALAP